MRKYMNLSIALNMFWIMPLMLGTVGHFAEKWLDSEHPAPDKCFLSELLCVAGISIGILCPIIVIWIVEWFLNRKNP